VRQTINQAIRGRWHETYDLASRDQVIEQLVVVAACVD